MSDNQTDGPDATDATINGMGMGSTARPLPDFECRVIAVDVAQVEFQHRSGQVVYVQLVRGTLPMPPKNVLVRPADTVLPPLLLPRPPRDEVVLTPATLIVPQGRIYAVTLLCVLPPLAAMRPYLRAGFHPLADLDPAAIPVGLEGLTWHFRPVGARLLAGAPDVVRAEAEHGGAVITRPEWRPPEADFAALQADRRRAADGDAEALGRLLAALSHENERMRDVAAYQLLWIADRLPVTPFLQVMQDRSELNAAALRVAGRVFGLHTDEVPLEVVLDLYHTQVRDPEVQMEAVRALGSYGDHAPLDLLIEIACGPRAYDERVVWQAAVALQRLGDRVPIDVLVRMLNGPRSSTWGPAARAILAHSTPVSEELRAQAERVASRSSTRESPGPP